MNTAVNQMDQVTQQNAAMVEEATAASHSLTGEAEELAKQVARFRVVDGRAAPRNQLQTCGAPLPQAVPASGGRRAGRGALAVTAVAPAQESWEEF